MKEVIGNFLYFAVWVVPLAGLAAAFLLAGWPSWSVSRRWAVTFSILAAAICVVWTVSFWTPGDVRFNAALLATVAITGFGLAMTILVLQVSTHGRAFGLVRALAVLSCVLSSLAVVLVALLGVE